MTQFTIDDGWLTGVMHLPSPNFNARPKSGSVRLVVIHNISLPPKRFGNSYVEDFFLNKLDSSQHPYFKTIAQLKVSSHLYIKRTGKVIQFVSLNDRAWHAGASCYLGVPNCNDYAIGIELEGCDDKAFTAAQYAMLTQVVKSIHHAYPATKNHLAGHSDIARGRKTDPGTHFNWQAFRKGLLTP